MKKFLLLICLTVPSVGCPPPDNGSAEVVNLQKEIGSLKERIKIATEVEHLKSQRDVLKAELQTIQTRPEGELAPVTSDVQPSEGE